ncbi:hypothetical protein HHI36_016678 [Cryptolaemus montrouzieri]|uniref:Uncharacterized protein n=1 Tax=Cryptolaemus montrouzieri TaxID=559131 RepID=A0ABD2NKU5_9CUCU
MVAPGYSIYRSQTNVGHSGACTYVGNEIIDEFVVAAFYVDVAGIDDIFLDISDKCGSTLTVGCIYRPRLCSHDRDMSELSASRNNLYVAGDFNLPVLQSPLEGGKTY